jgi:hypothetical protein
MHRSNQYLYSIISSARPLNGSGTVMPSIPAVSSRARSRPNCRSSRQRKSSCTLTSRLKAIGLGTDRCTALSFNGN